MRSHIITITFVALLSHVQISWAENNLFDSFSVRLAKSPDTKDAAKPALLGYQRNDGGKSDYITQGAIKAGEDFCQYNACSLSPNASWNHNSLASTPTNNWAVGLDLKRRWVVNAHADALVASAGFSQQRDETKSSNAGIVKAALTWYGWPEWKQAGFLDYIALRPTFTVFDKHVTQAAADKNTGVIPTGTMSGESLFLDAEAFLGRWSISATTQALRTEHVVMGDHRATHYLHTLTLAYQFVDAPRTGAELKDAKWIPSIALIRQVGDDPLAAIPKAGYSQLVFTVQY